jgi:hypothetical protein
MSYREENGQVILTMSREDYGRICILIGAACDERKTRSLLTLRKNTELLNRLNEGNSQYTPYVTARGR